MTVRVGVTLPQFTGEAETLLDGARRAEECGLDSVWVFDHLWPLTGGKTRPIIESWTALAAVAAGTERIRIGTLVTRSTLRHPVLLAKMAATVAAIAPGRLTLTIGSGDRLSRAENEAFGLPYFDGPDRLAQLESTVRVVRSFLNEKVVDIKDRFVQVDRLPASPAPDDPVPVWVGGRSPEAMEIAGRIADGWNGWGGPPESFLRLASKVRALASERPFDLSWGGQVVLGESDSAAATALGTRSEKDYVTGGPATVAATLRQFADAGAGHVILSFSHAADPATYELLATEVVPLL